MGEPIKPEITHVDPVVWQVPLKHLHALERARPLCPDHRDKASGFHCLLCEIERLRAALDAAEVQAEHYRTMSMARQDEIGLLRDRIRGNEITISELQIDLGECRRLLREACVFLRAARAAGGGDE